MMNLYKFENNSAKKRKFDALGIANAGPSFSIFYLTFYSKLASFPFATLGFEEQPQFELTIKNHQQ